LRLEHAHDFAIVARCKSAKGDIDFTTAALIDIKTIEAAAVLG
jgi:hypothetical protein